MAFGLLKV